MRRRRGNTAGVNRVLDRDPLEADSNSVANTTSAQGAGEVDAEATTEADSGRAGRDRSAAERWLGRAGDRAGAWPLAQRDQYGDRARPGTGRQLRCWLSADRGGSAAGDAGPGWRRTARCLPRWRSCCGCSGRRSRSRGGASAWRMERNCRPDYECRTRRSTRRSTPCRAVSCGASCSPACARPSHSAADGPRPANGGAGSAT